jgi:alkanesulfonate monooxygenase SsuD/methylene tetrahydromethanopterin reductase-like flavin-dependent oxidoreductase (luciferase family)
MNTRGCVSRCSSSRAAAPSSAYVGDVDFGAHLPLLDFGDHPFTLDHLVDYTRAASDLGFAALSANDHLIFAAPRLDGPTALAAVASHSGAMTLATTVALPVVHRPEAVLRDRLPVGSADAFAEKLVAFRNAGVQRVFIWPVADERRQLELFVDKVVPLLDA